MWRELWWKIGRSTKSRPGRNRPPSSDSSSDSEEDDGRQSDSSGISGHYSFQHHQPQGSTGTISHSALTETGHDVNDSDTESSDHWREKFDFTLSLIGEPRYLLPETLVAEQLKLTLKQQAFLLEKNLLQQTIREDRHGQQAPSTAITNQHRRADDNGPTDIASLQKQLKLVNQRLASLTGRLEVLKAVQQVLPNAALGAGINPSDADEPDSLEPTVKVPASSPAVTEIGASRSASKTPSSDATEEELLALLRLERLAQQATQRDYELLRKQYQRLKEELEWRDSGHGGDDSADLAEDSSTMISDRDRDSDSVQMKPSVALKSWTWRSAHSRQSGTTSTNRRNSSNKENNESTCSSLESIGCNQLWAELQAREKTVLQLRSRLNQVEPIAAACRAQVQQFDMINKELERQNQELQTTINSLTADVEELKRAQLVEQDDSDRTFVSNDESIQRKRTYKVTENKDFVQLRATIIELERKEVDYQARIEELERMQRQQSNCLPEMPNLEELERHVNQMESELETKDKEIADLVDYVTSKEEECLAITQQLNAMREESGRLRLELDEALNRDREQSTSKLDQITRELVQAQEANKRLQEDINRERVLRKKYFNTIEDLKGKIRVYCRLRPLTPSEQRLKQHFTADVIDPYTVVINSPNKGAKEFHFDRVFHPEESQEAVFEDTNTLVQSAFDGYNVCICAYGQTGSGKTHTIIGDESQPGLAPRTFERIFQLAAEHQAQFDVKVSCSMIELYNDRLIDLLRGDSPEVKLEIKKDKRGIVWVQGSRVNPVKSATALSELFRCGLRTRHTGSTRMNDRSSRSHLVVSINIECSSRLHGTVVHGKVSLLDLAGSERFAKSGSSGDQLREASSINKSLSTLGDVISALATDQQHTPYRNSKLTMLMQDSLGGNAKTLLFVTASIAASNLDETIASLTYASRAKEVTNAAQRNAESKEIARLKAIISRLKRGEDCGEHG